MKPLDLTALEQLLDVHGANVRRWPEHLRSAAEQCIATHPAAADMFAAAQHLDVALAALPEPLLPPSLGQRILAAAPGARISWRRTLTQLWQELGGYRLAGPVLACGLLAGVALPMLDDPLSTASEPADLISVAQLGEEQWLIADLETSP